MNLVGKIFTVFIFLMAVAFAAFATSVYVTHRNWMTVAIDKSKELTTVKEERKVIQEKNQVLNEEIKSEKERMAKDLTKLENEKTELLSERVKNEKRIADLEASLRDSVAAMKATHEQLANLRTRVTTLTEDIRTARKERADVFKDVIRLKDELNAAVDETTRLQKRTEELAKDVAKSMECLRYFGLNPDSDYKWQRAPVGTKGHILAVQGNDMIEVSIGSDMGLRKGHKLEVLRGTGGAAEYVGRVEVVHTAFDRSVCRIDPKMLRKPMQRGDNVVSELN